MRDQRESLRYRMSLVKMQTSIKNRIHATLHRHGVLHEFSDLFGFIGEAEKMFRRGDIFVDQQKPFMDRVRQGGPYENAVRHIFSYAPSTLLTKRRASVNGDRSIRSRNCPRKSIKRGRSSANALIV